MKGQIALHLRTAYTNKTVKHRVFFDFLWSAVSNAADDNTDFYMASRAGITSKLIGGFESGKS